MTARRGFARYAYVLGWRFRYLWFDTSLGPRCRLTAAAMVAVFAAWQFVDGMRAVGSGQPMQAIWPQIAMFVISMLISYALTPKTPDAVDQPGQAPKVEDGAGVRMVFGEVWITDPHAVGWRKIGTQTIRGKKSGFNGRPIIGFWYKQLFHFVLCRGPVDAVLEFRGGDKTAWAGELQASGDVQINKKDLWGGTGTGGEGGIEGPMEFRFGDEAQLPSGYLAGAEGPQQSAHRGLLTAVFKGGLWGAFSPYPKVASFKVRRILEGWEREGGAWYKEKSAISFISVMPLVAEWQYKIAPYHPLPGHENLSPPVDGWSNGRSPFWSGGWVWPGSIQGNTDWPTDTTLWARKVVTVPAGSVKMLVRAENGCVIFLDGELHASVNRDNGQIPSGGVVEFVVPSGVHEIVVKAFDEHPAEGDTYFSMELVSSSGSFRMNPAHILYQSIADSWMGAEPEAQINDDSFRAAADVLYAEGFGLCTEWISSDETVEAFQRRICNVIGANLSRSPIDGKWNLDLIRGGYDTSRLPVLTDDDILDYTEQPGTLVDTVNQVIVEWRDPQQREDRSTAPVQSLGSIQAAGAVIGEVATYREIPDESLALRVAGRDLQSKCRPLRRITGKVTRVAHAWRPGQVINLQSTKRGIASMYCRVGDIDRGTLRSGAISLSLLQDVFGLPQAVYVQPEPGANTDDDDVVKPVAAAALQEAPFALLAALQPPGELAALTPDAGHIFAVATPVGAELDYSLLVDAGVGYMQQAESDWSATATNSTPYGQTETSISIEGVRNFDDVVIGAMVLWGSEVCRLDGVDLIAGTIKLGRGCADTVPSDHAAGDRIWVIDDSIALDVTRYSAGATVVAKLLPRTASQRLDEADVTGLAVGLASRAARPYPPGNFLINGTAYPRTVFGAIEVTAAHRDRLLQAAHLVDTAALDIGPEPGTTYTVRAYQGGNLISMQADLSAPVTTINPLANGIVTVELEAVCNGVVSWQKHNHSFRYTTGPANSRMTVAGDRRVTVVGDGRITIG